MKQGVKEGKRNRMLMLKLKIVILVPLKAARDD